MVFDLPWADFIISHDASFNQLQQDLSVLLLETLEFSYNTSKQDEMVSRVLRVSLDPMLQVTGGCHKESLHHSTH